MKVDFEQLPGSARLWIYQSSEELTDNQAKELGLKVSTFLENWESHGHPLRASYKIYYKRFLVLAVDQSFYNPSGCSIDSSVHFIREIESSFKITLLEKSTIAVLDNNQIKTYQLKDIKNKIKEGLIRENNLIFNNLISTLDELNEKWQIPAKDSWLSKNFL